MDEFEGKVAVVTGAASGIGQALARRCAAEGMKVVLADIEAEPLEAMVAELRAQGTEVASLVTDVSDGDQVDALGRAAADAFGSVHLVFNNAGVGGGGLIQTLTTADWEWVLGVNLWGVIHGMRVFLPMLIEQGEGHIVNTASMAGLVAAPFMGPYNASKFAVVAISETAYQELQMLGSEVGVSVLCPAWVRTRIHEAARNRPAALQNEAVADDGDAAADSGIGGIIGGLIAGGLPPEEVADHVFQAVRDKRLWILTHPETADAVQRRMESIISGQFTPFVIPQ